MTSLAQLLLTVVVTTLTFFLAVAGIQVFQILHEFRFTLKRLNKILANTQTLSESAAKPITAVNSFFSEVSHLVDETKDTLVEDVPDKVITPRHAAAHSSLSRRFFHRSGLPLRPS